MKYVKRFGLFWYHFVVGDDWRIAASVALGLGLTALLVHGLQVQLWWLLPAVVIMMLTFSLWLATRLRN